MCWQKKKCASFPQLRWSLILKGYLSLLPESSIFTDAPTTHASIRHPWPHSSCQHDSPMSCEHSHSFIFSHTLEDKVTLLTEQNVSIVNFPKEGGKNLMKTLS